MVDPEVEMVNPADWDVICDVRTPDEFEEDHLIGAINTPVLSNEQRAEVGTLYKQMYALADQLTPTADLSVSVMLLPSVPTQTLCAVTLSRVCAPIAHMLGFSARR